MGEKDRENREQEQQNFEFMKEQIKERPINKKKLVRRMIITASMAVLFGLIACVTVLGLEPVINNWLYPEEPAENISFPEEKEEILPEDMVLDDAELEETQAEEESSETEVDSLQMISDSYDSLRAIADEASESLVTVTGITSNTDWFANVYENKDQAPGLILADNKKELLVLTNRSALNEAESVRVTLGDGTQLEASVKSDDEVTGILILAIAKESIPQEVRENIKIARLGSSNGQKLTASPVIALGSPMGLSGSIMYGIITSNGNALNLPDRRCKLMTTDICGSKAAAGVLVNLNGEVVGIINQNYNDAGLENMIAAIGISELKPTIERMSNGQPLCCVGITGMDVTQEANKELGVPYGAYVTEVEMDSAAMNAGIQSGDVIVGVGEIEISDYEDYVKTIRKLTPETTEEFSIMRQGHDGYTPMTFQIKIGEVE